MTKNGIVVRLKLTRASWTVSCPKPAGIGVIYFSNVLNVYTKDIAMTTWTICTYIYM